MGSAFNGKADDLHSTNAVEIVIWNGYLENHQNNNNNNSNQIFYYNPTDARVECFGLELAVRNKDMTILKYLWNENSNIWEAKHFGYMVEKMLYEEWEQGIEFIFRSPT